MGKRKDNECWDIDKHPAHMCKLFKQGRMMEYDQSAENPTVACAKCGAKAHRAESVCQPRPL